MSDSTFALPMSAVTDPASATEGFIDHVKCVDGTVLRRGDMVRYTGSLPEYAGREACLITFFVADDQLRFVLAIKGEEADYSDATVAHGVRASSIAPARPEQPGSPGTLVA